MITVTEFAQQKVGIFGLGKAGEAAIISLHAGGAKVFGWDDKLAASGELQVESNFFTNSQLATRNYIDWPWTELKALVLSPGIPLTYKPHPVVELAKKHNVPIIGDMELLYRAQPDATYIGITGTNGKSTTTTLIGHIFNAAGRNAQVGGNLGTPALALEPLGKDGVYVIETSSYQLDLLERTRFNVAVLLNVTPDHLDRHGDMEGYVAAKMHIFDRQQPSDTAVIATDDDYTKAAAGKIKNAKLVEVSAQHKIMGGIYAKDAVLHDGFATFDLSKIATLTGRHNWQNAAVAYAAARACNIGPDAIYNAMQTFGGLRHRLQLVATIQDVRFINDSKATNADATANALAPYKNIYWILGGKPKAGGISTLTEYFPKIVHAFLIGEAQDEFAATLEGKVKYTRCFTIKAAVKKATEAAFTAGKKDAVVLLSPACASFDQFKSFEERGDVFCKLVEELNG